MANGSSSRICANVLPAQIFGRISVRHDFDADILEAGLADLAGHRGVSLQREGAFGQPGRVAGKTVYRVSLGNLEREHGLAIEFDRHQTVPADNLLRVPNLVLHRRAGQINHGLFVVGGGRFRAPGQIEQAIQTTRAAPIDVAVVHLAFESFSGEAGILEFRVKVDARVGSNT